jgi:hypothetical protein
MMIAALYVQTNGCYFGLPGVDPWDEQRDARKYQGPWPVVAHPPCQRWGKMWMGSPSYVAKTGIRKKKGDDSGCFMHALACVRAFGGVLEHPWGSYAWPHFGLRIPPRTGGWVKADECGGFACCVEQGQYGHYARKPTLLYFVPTLSYFPTPYELPELLWGHTEANYPQWAIDKYGIKKVKRMGELAFKGGGKDSSARIGTPTAFRDLLVNMARSAS